MTGNVPYYGGRFTPAQAYAAAHPSAQRPPPPPTGRVAMPSPDAGPDAEAALRHLRDSGVLTPEEYDELLTRVRR